MKIKEAIIIAGGLGKRLKKVVKDVPKPMADINGVPFLQYLIDFLIENHIERVILSLGYKSKIITDYFSGTKQKIKIDYSIEASPLGTGGGIKKAFAEVNGDNALILNGDTLFKIDIYKLSKFHNKKSADISVALKKSSDPKRYGTIKIDPANRIYGFKEKNNEDVGLINGGIYIAKKALFHDLPAAFSFEKDFLEQKTEELRFFGLPFDDYFIDIGVPTDYARAKKEFK